MKAVIYARVSTEEQDTARQHAELLELAKKEGYTVESSFEDKITGASKAETRKGFEKMLKFITAENIKQVYCWELSRLGRSMINIYQVIREFRESNINICIKKENINTLSNDKNTQLQLNLLASIAEYERETIKERTISGTYNSIRNGGAGGGSIKQYGYKKVNGKLVIDTEEANVIKDICNKYLCEDWSVKQIADYLNVTGIKTRYKKLIDAEIINYKVPSPLLWTEGSIARLLHKQLLTGNRKYGKVQLKDESLRILDDSTFEAIQLKMMEKRKTKANAQKYQNIFKNVLYCANCGSPMIMHKGKSSSLNNHYKCFQRFVKKSDCTSSMINIDLLNNAVYDRVKEFIVESNSVNEKIKKLETQIEINNNSISQIRVKLDDLSKKEERLVDLYIAGKIALNIYENRLKQIQEDNVDNQKQIVKSESLNSKLSKEIIELRSKKNVDLKNPNIFKSNINSLVEKIELKTMDDFDISEYNRILNNYGDKIERVNKREIWYHLNIKMFDNRTNYVKMFSNHTNNFDDLITVDLI
ncbi:recombinase family protein [Gaoshiqia sediminis]|uniref:Recombinase family protein n=1 Tax=Gaoshiqia sediminis TaxID=2986998 RepID=A0AA41YAG0_9BACT|nr:recombinase family protein [Gaoshiqia sediminis]MCW0484676.1 recombinase family protein [Gaoshiqia sediminis]